MDPSYQSDLVRVDSVSRAWAEEGRITDADSLLSTVTPTVIRSLSSDDSMAAARLLMRHAYTRYEASDYRSADNLYGVSEGLRRSLPDSLQTRAYRAHATVKLWREDYEGALRMLDRAERIARAVPLREELRAIYRSKSNITSYIGSAPMDSLDRDGIPIWYLIFGLLLFLLRRVLQSPQKPDPESHAAPS